MVETSHELEQSVLLLRIGALRQGLASREAVFRYRTRYPAWSILKRWREADPVPRSGLRLPRGLSWPLDSDLHLKPGAFEASCCLFEVGGWRLSEIPGQVVGSGSGDLLPPLVWATHRLDVSDSYVFFVGLVDGFIEHLLLVRPYRSRPEMFLKRVHYFDGGGLQGGAGVLGLIDRQGRWFLSLEGIDNDLMTARFAGGQEHCQQIRDFYELAAVTEASPITPSND